MPWWAVLAKVTGRDVTTGVRAIRTLSASTHAFFNANTGRFFWLSSSKRVMFLTTVIAGVDCTSLFNLNGGNTDGSTAIEADVWRMLLLIRKGGFTDSSTAIDGAAGLPLSQAGSGLPEVA